MTENIGRGFRNAEGACFDALLHCLDFMNDLPFFKAYKAHSWQSLEIEPGQLVVDVACGTGADLIHLACRHPATKFIGVDKSEGFLNIGKERSQGLTNLQFLPADAQSLPFGDNSVDAMRIDRSLQHMESPASVLKEMARVTKSGGKIVACEPDWETFVLFNGEVDDSWQLANFFQHSIRNPWMGRELATLMNEGGVTHFRTHVHGFWTNQLAEAAVIFDLERVKNQCAAADRMTQDDADTWWAMSEQASLKGTFFASLNIVEVSGIVA
jgi:ubiquinone/menaquinone biosynthesis C-methylase UbiE